MHFHTAHQSTGHHQWRTTIQTAAAETIFTKSNGIQIIPTFCPPSPIKKKKRGGEEEQPFSKRNNFFFLMHLFTMPFCAPNDNHRSRSLRIRSWDQKICLQRNHWGLLRSAKWKLNASRGNKKPARAQESFTVIQVTHQPPSPTERQKLRRTYAKNSSQFLIHSFNTASNTPTQYQTTSKPWRKPPLSFL